MERQYDGVAVIDNTGHTIGHVDRTYVDDGGAVRLVEVKMDTVLAAHRLVPVDTASLTDEGLTVPYTKDEIEGSPNEASLGDTIDHETLTNLQAYYGRGAKPSRAADTPAGTFAGAEPSGAPVNTGMPKDDAMEAPITPPIQDREADRATAGGRDDALEAPITPPVRDRLTAGGEEAQFGEIRDLGGVIEIPIVEEQLVKRVVVKEVLRVRKAQVAEIQNVEGDIRKESIEVERTGESSARDDTAGPALE